jgi:hypothetical protein
MTRWDFSALAFATVPAVAARLTLRLYRTTCTRRHISAGGSQRRPGSPRLMSSRACDLLHCGASQRRHRETERRLCDKFGVRYCHELDVSAPDLVDHFGPRDNRRDSRVTAVVGSYDLGPSIWVQTLGFSQSVFPFEPLTIVAMPLAFVLCFTVSWVQGHCLQVRTAGI